MNKPDPIMTVEEVAKYLHLHPLTVRRLAGDGEIPAFKVGLEAEWRLHMLTAIARRWPVGAMDRFVRAQVPHALAISIQDTGLSESLCRGDELTAWSRRLL